jgi:carbon-monoxide dehydrogenase large subunit
MTIHDDKTVVASGGVGARVRRTEDQRHLNGRGRFVSDIKMPELQEVAFLRSPLAHARISGVHKPESCADCVLLREDLTGVRDIESECSIPGYKLSAHPPLARDKVRFVGEPMALAFAETRAGAEDIAEQVEIDMDELPAIANVFEGRDSTDVRVHDDWENNVFLTMDADNNFDAAAADAPVVVKRTMDLGRQAMNPMEGKAVLAYWDHQADQLVVYTSTQVPHVIRQGIADHLDIAQTRLRVVAPDVGGGFGYKCILQPEELCIAWLALHYKKPFRYTEDRREHLTAGANSRQHHYDLVAYCDKNGRMLALDANIIIDNGAYSSWPFTAALEPAQATGNLPGPYDLAGYRCHTECIATTKPGFLPYRGVARTGVCFAIELLMDAIAREVGREAWEVRSENLVKAASMPYRNIINKNYDSGDYPTSLTGVVKMIDFEGVRERQKKSEPDGRLIGVGFATYTEQSAHGATVFSAWGLSAVPGYDQAFVRVTPDGGLEVRIGVQGIGQGIQTTMGQIANEILGVPNDRIQVLYGDTGGTPYSFGTFASRSMVVSGGAVSVACKALLPRLTKIGAHLLQKSEDEVEFDNGAVRAGDQEVSLAQIARAWYTEPFKLPPDVDPTGLEVTRAYKPEVDGGLFSYASHACVVAVDPEIGQVEILDYAIMEDCGRAVNPMIVEGQAFGGSAQGIGTALFEEAGHDDNGQPMASTLMDYLLPGSTEIPDFRIEHMETASPHSEFGIKGIGESGAIAPPSAIFNAVNDALAQLSVEVAQTPLTPQRLLAALDEAKQSNRAAADSKVAAEGQGSVREAAV